MMQKILFILMTSVLLPACAQNELLPQHNEQNFDISELPSLPLGISNNAVASVHVDSEIRLYSFLGLEEGKDWQNVSKKVFRYARNQWTQLDDVPVSQGRLASIAVTVDNQIYLLGGYTVAEDHSEASTPEVLRFNPQDETYQRVANIPIPADDATAFVYQDRYIYLVSGWHDRGNINLVQVYDVESDEWKQATQFPGAPVFGHAGGIVGNKMLVCDGVKIEYPDVSEDVETKRAFTMSDKCYIGRIDDQDITRIHWAVVSKHPHAARYRMAAAGDESRQQLIFVGGSDNPYNFNGIGYNGVPSKPVSSVFAYDVVKNQWIDYGLVEAATMDHRGLLKVEDGFIIVGGLDERQNVLSKVYKISQEKQD